MVKYTVIIEETFGRSTGKDRAPNGKHPVYKREFFFPVDSNEKHVYKVLSRATMDLLYGLADHGFLDVQRAVLDLLNYEELEENGNE